MITYIRPEDRVNAKTQPRDINENYSLGTNYVNPNSLKKVIPKTIGPVNKTQIGKPMTYEMDSARKSDLKKMYNSIQLLKKNLKLLKHIYNNFLNH